MNLFLNPKHVACSIVLTVLSGSAITEVLPGPIPAEVVRVVDGDTIRVRARIWLGHDVEVSVRLAGIDAPEIYHPSCEAERIAGEAATAALEAQISGEVWLTDVTEDKFAGRVVADAHIEGPVNLSADLLARGHAVPMGIEWDWCA